MSSLHDENQPCQVTPLKGVPRAPILIEVPVNTQPSPTSSSIKLTQRLAGYTSPRKQQCTLDSLNEKLKSAEERRNNQTNGTKSKDKLERVQRNRDELDNQKKEAAAAHAAKITNAEVNRENLRSQRVKKAGQHVTRVKEVSSSIKKAEQSEYQSNREQMEKNQQAAAARVAQAIAQKKKSAANHHEKIQDTLAQKGYELRLKKAALDQKLKDAEARRNVVEVSKCMKATKPTAVVTSRAKIVIDIPLIKSPSGDGSKAKQRLEANKVTSTAELSKDAVDEKLKRAEERREQYLNQRLWSPTHKRNAQKFLQNRQQLECKKKESADAQAKRAADAEAKAKLVNQTKAKRAGKHCTKVKETMQSRAVAEAKKNKTKKESIETKQQAAQVRHQAQIQKKKNSAQALAIRIGENVKQQGSKLKEKRVAIDQKLKDAEARRNVVEAYKATPTKLRSNPSSPKRPPCPPASDQ